MDEHTIDYYREASAVVEKLSEETPADGAAGVFENYANNVAIHMGANADKAASLDPAWITLITQIASQLFAKCGAEKLQKKVEKIKRKPRGVDAIFAHARLTNSLPQRYAGLRAHIADSMVKAAVDVADTEWTQLAASLPPAPGD